MNPSYGMLDQNENDVEPVYEDMYEIIAQVQNDENVVAVTINSVRSIISNIRKLQILIALLSTVAVIAFLFAVISVSFVHV